MLSETKIADGFKAAGIRMNEIEKETKLAIQEMQQSFIELTKRLRTLSSIPVAGDKGPTRFWPSDEEAKEFGELVLVAVRKQMGTGSQTGGSALVPIGIASWIIQKLGQYGKFRRNALVVSMGESSLLVPKVESDLTIVCPGEGQTITPSDMEISQISLTARKLCALAKVSTELNEDSIIAIGEIIGLSVARSIAKKEDAIGFMGDGTSTYFGMKGICGALRAVNAVIANIKGLVVGTGNAYSELMLGDFRKVVGILPDDADDGAKWYMNKKFYYNVVYPLAEAAGVANIFEILSDRKGRFLLGYPVEFVSAMPNTEANSQICAILGDLTLGAYLGERRELRLESSEHVHFTTDQIGFRGTERIDINCYGVGDTEEAGPIVGLITAAS
jgi:HK97 family phage major capsid protein